MGLRLLSHRRCAVGWPTGCRRTTQCRGFMAHSERTRPSRNGAAGAGQHAVSSRPPWPLRQDQPASPDQAELVLCEQTIFAMSSPIVLACATDASSGGRSTPPPWHTDAVGGRPPHQRRLLTKYLPVLLTGHC